MVLPTQHDDTQQTNTNFVLLLLRRFKSGCSNQTQTKQLSNITVVSGLVDSLINSCTNSVTPLRVSPS